MDNVNPIDVVEAAYDLDVDDRTWVERLAALVRPLLDDGLGLVAYMFDLSEPVERWGDRMVTLGFNTALLPALMALQQAAPQVTRDFHSKRNVLMTATELLARGLQMPADIGERVQTIYASIGARDTGALQTVEPGGSGVVFYAIRREVRSFDPRTQRLWQRVAAHIAAGRRLRASLAADAAPIEAVLTTTGRVDHAEGEGTTVTARDALREAVLRQERARGAGRRDGATIATESWTALVSGRWSLVDQFERGGRRYIVARRNELGLVDPRALTHREHAIASLAALAKANKLIAYELGLSESTVATHLASAMRKLGARSRVDLVRLVSQLGPGKHT